MSVVSPRATFTLVLGDEVCTFDSFSNDCSFEAHGWHSCDEKEARTVHGELEFLMAQRPVEFRKPLDVSGSIEGLGHAFSVDTALAQHFSQSFKPNRSGGVLSIF